MIIFISYNDQYKKYKQRIVYLKSLFKKDMQQLDSSYRQKSLSNNSSIITSPKLQKKLSDFKKYPLTFTQILNKQKSNQSNLKNISLSKQKISSHTPTNPQKSKLQGKYEQSTQVIKKTKNTTPCKELFSLFINHRISSQYIELMQRHKFKHLVIISVILPPQLMKKVSRFIDFSKQYRISIPQTPFSTDFLQLGKSNNLQDAKYVFWTYEVSEGEDNLRNSLNTAYGGVRRSSISVKSIREFRSRRFSSVEQYSMNMHSLMVEVPQIVITTKSYIKDHSELFFPQFKSDLVNSSLDSNRISLYSQLDVERSLFYFDEEEVSYKQKSVSTPKYMQNSSSLIRQMKIKNPQLKGNSYIQIDPDEEFYDVDGKDRENRPILQKGELDKIDTARSQSLIRETQKIQKSQNEQFMQLLQRQSKFKHINYLPSLWLQSNPSESIQNHSKKRTSPLILSQQRSQKFKLMLTQQIKLKLKKNHLYSKFCSTWLFLHFITNFYQHNIPTPKRQQNEIQTQSYSGLLNKSLKSLKKQIQLRFIQRVDTHYKEVLDDAALRNLFRTIKKDQIVFMKKNLQSIVFPSTFKSGKDILFNHHQSPIDKSYLSQMEHEIINSMDKLQEEIYFENNKQASIFNQKLLQTEYQKIVEAGFRRQKLKKKQSFQNSSSWNSEERPSFTSNQKTSKKQIPSEIISNQLQKDFNDFIDAYWTKGIKVSSQLKTFNDFMDKSKKSYLKEVHLLIHEKKTYQKEEQQRENKTRTIKLLEMEIFKIQDKRRQVKDKNEIIKKQIKIQDQKLQLQQRNQSSIPKDKGRSGRLKQGRSMFLTGTDKFSRQSEKNKSFIEPMSARETDKRFKKSPALSFQIESRRKIRKSDQIDSGKYSQNRYDQSYGKNSKKQSFHSKNQAINQQAEQKLKKKRCLNSCCQIM